MGNLEFIKKQVEGEKMKLTGEQAQNAQNRYLQEVIDTIYKNEAEYTADNVSIIQKDIKSWAKTNPYPNNVQPRFIFRNREQEKLRVRKEHETLMNDVVDLDEETSA